MKFEIAECCQCGNEFKRTNRRQSYCSGACRVSAHRDRHGYEQPIFTYPTIRAIENMREMDIDALYRLKILAVNFLLDWQEKKKNLPTDLEMKLLLVQLQLRTELEDEKLNEVFKVIAPLSDLLNLVRQIQDDDKNNSKEVAYENQKH